MGKYLSHGWKEFGLYRLITKRDREKMVFTALGFRDRCSSNRVSLLKYCVW